MLRKRDLEKRLNDLEERLAKAIATIEDLRMEIGEAKGKEPPRIPLSDDLQPSHKFYPNEDYKS